MNKAICEPYDFGVFDANDNLLKQGRLFEAWYDFNQMAEMTEEDTTYTLARFAFDERGVAKPSDYILTARIEAGKIYFQS